MVICKYFLTNSCNFGTQCKNEHINVATVVKTDAEAAIKGKQWVLSAYGPFKDKPSLPNFEEQSFEEIRSLCYEAKNNGNLQALLPQLSQQTADASYKISMLCDVNNVNNNLLNILVNLYNSGESTGNTQSNSLSAQSNPFAINTAVGGGSQSSSIFGSNTTQQQNPFGSNLFGSNNPTPPSSSIFGVGSGNSASSATTNSFFGQQGSFGNTGASVFGGQSAFGGSTAPSAFGGSTAPSVFGGSTAPSAFGGSTASSNAFGTSAFGQPATAAASPFSLSQIAQPTDPSKQTIFGASQFQQTQNSIFGAAPAFSNPIQPSKPSGLFSTPNTNSMFGQSQSAASTGLFGQSNNANQPANSGNLFSSFGAAAPQQQQQQTQGLFGGPTTENKSVFGQATNPNQSIFGANQQQTNQGSNIFANALAQQQNTPNVFGVQQQAVQPEQQQSIFNQSNSNTTSGSNIFQNQANVPAMGGSIFGGSSFGQAEQVNTSAYCKLEDLKPEDLEWFQAESFVLGRIPTVPPPRELCV